MEKRIVDETVLTQKHPVRPGNINTKRNFVEAFGNLQTEASACWIVRLCDEIDGWKSFTEEQMEVFYRKNSKYTGFSFNRLTTEGFVVLGDDDKYRVTHEFICRCFMSSPQVDLFETKETNPA